MSYNGYMQVFNNWCTPISGYVTHTSGSEPSATVNFSNLAVGAYSNAVEFTTSDDHTDTWAYSMTDAGGFNWQGSKDCGYESSDEGQTVTLIFSESNMEFRIQMPVSSPCTQGLAGYLGFFNVQNNSWGVITGTVTHQAGSYPSTTISLTNLAVGATSNMSEIQSGPSSADTWSYVINVGNINFLGSMQCGFEAEDTGGNATVVIQGTLVSNATMVVNPPVSSSCSAGLDIV